MPTLSHGDESGAEVRLHANWSVLGTFQNQLAVSLYRIKENRHKSTPVILMVSAALMTHRLL